MTSYLRVSRCRSRTYTLKSSRAPRKQTIMDLLFGSSRKQPHCVRIQLRRRDGTTVMSSHTRKASRNKTVLDYFYDTDDPPPPRQPVAPRKTLATMANMPVTQQTVATQTHVPTVVTTQTQTITPTVAAAPQPVVLAPTSQTTTAASPTAVAAQAATPVYEVISSMVKNRQVVNVVKCLDTGIVKMVYTGKFI